MPQSTSVQPLDQPSPDAMLAVHDALRAELQRPLRVLDLGAGAAGLAVRLAAQGAQVRACDSDPQRIARYRSEIAQYPQLDIEIQTASLDDSLAAHAGQVDLLLAPDLAARLLAEQGCDALRLCLATLTETAAIAVVALPEPARACLPETAFVHEIAPALFVLGEHHWVLPPHAGPIDSHQRAPHALASDHYRGTRHYYRSGSRLLKLFRHDTLPELDNRGELQRETDFLRHPPAGFIAPELHEHGEDARSAWLIRDWTPGRLLLDCLDEEPPPDPHAVLGAVLDQLALLESVGLYHSDLRVWNLLRCDDGRILLLDYGSISPTPGDRTWPEDPFLSLLILIHELLAGEPIRHPEPLRPAAISPWRLPQPYRDWIARVWEHPLEQWRFGELAASFKTLDPGAQIDTPSTPAQRWAAEIENAIDIQSRFMSDLHWHQEQQAQLQQLNRDYAELKAWSERVHEALEHERIEHHATRTRAEQAEQRAAHAEPLAAAHEARALAAEQRAAAAEEALSALLASSSWRLTAPLRWLTTRLRSARRITRSLLIRLRPWLVRLIALLYRLPGMRALAQRLLALLPPGLRARLRGALLPGAPPVEIAAVTRPEAVEHSRRALSRALGETRDSNKSPSPRRGEGITY